MQRRSWNFCSNWLHRVFLVSHCTDAFYPHFVCAHLGKIDIAVEALMNTISSSSVAHVKPGIQLQVASHSIFTLLPSCLPCITHTCTHTHTRTHRVLLPGREELPEMCFNLPNDIPQKPWQPRNSESVCGVFCLPLKISSAHQPHRAWLTALALSGLTPHLSGDE